MSTSLKAPAAAEGAAAAAAVLEAASAATLDEVSCRTCTLAGAASVATGARKNRYLRLGILLN
jgi:hypothetical protein